MLHGQFKTIHIEALQDVGTDKVVIRKLVRGSAMLQSTQLLTPRRSAPVFSIPTWMIGVLTLLYKKELRMLSKYANMSHFWILSCSTQRTSRFLTPTSTVLTVGVPILRVARRYQPKSQRAAYTTCCNRTFDMR